MKTTRNIVTGLILFLFLACTQTKNEGNSSSPAAASTEEHVAAEESHSEELTLNNGVKWQTDESTRFHAAKLNAAIDEFNKIQNADLPAYHAFAAGMQNELGGLVKDCKMKGADHEALHLWLEPVMKEVGDLKKVTTVGEGKLTAELLTEDVKKFNQFFENAD